jgi:hypothetical protein
MKYPHISTAKLIYMYTVMHLSGPEMHRQTGMTRAGIMKRLKKAGITSAMGEWVTLNCAFCGKEINRTRQRYHATKEHYCNAECYYASRENPGFKPWRHGARLARAIVSQYITLQDGWVVHHVDGDQRNNDLANLAIYASQADHIKFHHGKNQVKPVWEGKYQNRVTL